MVSLLFFGNDIGVVQKYYSLTFLEHESHEFHESIRG